MSGSSNIQQWNPSQSNQESDTQYAADTMRTGGASANALFPSVLANKLFYQLTTFAAAFSQALAAKGYVVNDASLTNLAGILASVMTQADMSPYALLNSPAFTGAPTVPPAATHDNSRQVASTNWVLNLLLNSPQMGGIPTTPAPLIGDNSLALANTIWVNSRLTSYAALSQFIFAATGQGSLQLPSGFILQWGQMTSSASGPTFLSFPLAFPTACITVICSAVDTACNVATAMATNTGGSNFSRFGLWLNNWSVTSGSVTRQDGHDTRYLAIGN